RFEPATYAARRWLCQTAYEVEQARLLRAHADDPRLHAPGLSPSQLRERILAEHEQRSGLRHPMSAHLFHGTPSRRDVLVYLEHHWYRSRGFHRELAELSLQLPLPEARSVVDNLHEELGEGQPGRAHPELLQRLLVHMDVPCNFDRRPS